MCWNQYVSINTFVFGIFGLLLIAFNNKFSDYKLEFFNNPYAYLFMLSFIFMQFFEFILWRNLNNYTINNIVSILGSLLLAVQPITTILLIKNISFRNKLLMAYSIPAAAFSIYNIFTNNLHTILSPSGHLAWKWDSNINKSLKLLIKPFFLLFLFFPLIYNGYYESLILLLLYLIFVYYFGKDGSSGSIWCLSVNSIILYFVVKILIIMPIYEITNKLKLN
jgi:hypothetical protein